MNSRIITILSLLVLLLTYPTQSFPLSPSPLCVFGKTSRTAFRFLFPFLRFLFSRRFSSPDSFLLSSILCFLLFHCPSSPIEIGTRWGCMYVQDRGGDGDGDDIGIGIGFGMGIGEGTG